MPDPCENWASTPGPKRIALESSDKIKLPIMYAFCFKIYLPIQKCRFQMCYILLVRAIHFRVRISHTLCEQYNITYLIAGKRKINFPFKRKACQVLKVIEKQ